MSIMNTHIHAWWERYWGWMLIAAAVAVSIIYYMDVSDQERRSRCQALYNQTFSQVLNIRSESSGLRQDAVDDLISGVGRLIINPPTTAAEQKRAESEYQRLFKHYDEVVKQNNEVRAANPLPNFPKCSV